MRQNAEIGKCISPTSNREGAKKGGVSPILLTAPLSCDSSFQHASLLEEL